MAVAAVSCPKKAVLWVPFASMSGTFGIVTCFEDVGHDGDHKGEMGEYEAKDGLTPGELVMRFPTITSWMDEDRRTYEGDLVLCIETAGCVCPAGHPGRCAT